MLLVLFSFILSAVVSSQVFEHLPHLEDEDAYLWEARALAGGQAVLTSTDPSRPFWQPFVLDREGKRFGKYPLGWPGLLAVGVLLGQTWVINAFLAAATVALTYRLGREIFNPDTGVFAAGLVAFSPMALLLNGTLMGHTSALCTTMLFLYAYWRMTRERRTLLWGVVAGIALGLTVINRPVAGIAVAAPLIALSAVRLIRAFFEARIVARNLDSARINLTELLQTLKPLLALSVITVVIALIIPLFNWMATGDPSKNLYTMVWSYDSLGFGEGHGRNIHTLEKGLRQTRWDLSLTAADVFGWQTGSIDANAREHILNEADYWPNVGLSWLLLPFGLLIGFRRRWWWWAIWLALGAFIFMQTTNLPKELLQNPQFAYLWMGGGAVWVLIPFTFLLFRKPDDQQIWTYVLLAIPLGLIGLHIAYWIGSQRYSTRYYYEMLGAFALLSAIPLGWLARRFDRLSVYIVFAGLMVYSLMGYSKPRIEPLYRFNWVSPELIEAVNSRRTGDATVLVIVQGTDVRWRSYGSLMVSTSPYLDSDIVAAWDNQQPGMRDAIIALFPGRQVIQMTADGNRACFGDTMEGECYGEPPS